MKIKKFNELNENGSMGDLMNPMIKLNNKLKEILGDYANEFLPKRIYV